MKHRVLFSSLVLLAACSNPDSATPGLPTIEYDASVPDVPDVPPDVPVPSTRVEIDLAPYLPAAGGNAVASTYQLEGDTAPFSGSVVAGRDGDWVIQNDVIRVLIEGEKRVMSPCPWGGTPIDAAYIADGDDEDILGEVCMLVNGALSFRPDMFEVLQDGSDGGAAVLAASGDLAINDFLNLPVMVDDFIPNFSERVSLDVNEVLPFRVTVYYILEPGRNDLQVVSALRNDGDVQIDTLPLYMVASGGNGYYFNPMSSTNGFGAGSASIGAALENLPFIAFNGERASYAFAPDPDPRLPASTLPLAGSYLVISGVAAAALGMSVSELLPILTSGKDVLAANERVMHVVPGGIHVLKHRLFVGDGALSTMVDPIYDAMDVATGTVEGTVTDPDGRPVAGARVTALRRGYRTMNQTISAADGSFSLAVPVEDYEIKARKGAWTPDGVTPVSVAVGQTVDAGTVGIAPPGVLRVHVTTPDDGCDTTTGAQPVPARMTVVCDGDCQKPGLDEADVDFHRLPKEYQTVVYGGVDGMLEAELPAGDYTVYVSRGMEWSVWPSAIAGQSVTILPKQSVELDAEIARVVQTNTAYSGDYHIHSISSPDSTVEYPSRVLSYAATGVDLLVSTDHDHISDHRPFVTDLSLNPWIQAIVGEEVTTADLGHFNSFPLVRDPSHARGGAVDWGNGNDFTLPPAQLYATLNEFPGDQVIQMNHAATLGLVKFSQPDLLRGITYASRTKHRLPPMDGAGKTADDTGMWSDDFTAMELMNGNSQSRFYGLARWWMTMIGRGFSPTGTAVTDTHKLYSDLGGVPRTYAFGNADVSCGDRRFDELSDYDGFVANYAQRVNAGATIGTNGPFFEVWVEDGAQQRTDLGEVASTQGGDFTAHVRLQAAEWVDIDTVDIYLNPPLADVLTRPGELIDSPIPPTQSIPVTWDEATQLVTVKSGAMEHKAWQQELSIPLQSDEDAFLVIVVHGSKSMQPVVGTTPFAFANPIFIDADGNGYDHPPYADAASVPPGPNDLPPCYGDRCGPLPTRDDKIKPEELIDVVRKLDCQNPIHSH